MSMNVTIGTVHAAATQPRAEAESLMSSTANASAIPDIDEPAVLTTSPKKNHRKFPIRRGEA
jgi:hypothetical protein